MRNKTNSTSLSFFSRAELISWTAAFALVDVVIIAGNAFALYIFLRKNTMHRSKAHYFLINLAVTDELVGSISLPLFIYQLMSFIKTSWNPWPVSIFVYMTIDLLSGFASMLTVVIIALDRFYAVCFPFRHRVTSKRAYHYLIFALWLFSGVVSGVWAFWVKDQSALSAIFAYFMFALILCFILTLAVAHVLILIKVKFLSVRRQMNNRKNRSEKEKRLTKILNIVTVAFLLTWLPFHFVNFTFFFSNSYDCIPLNAVIFTKFLQYAGSFVNPLVYYANNKEFRKTMSAFLQRGNSSLSSITLTKFTKKYSLSWKENNQKQEGTSEERYVNN